MIPVDEPRVRWANPTVLRWARERLHLSPEAVEEEAKRLSDKKQASYSPITAQDLVRWEAGEAEPEMMELETLAEIYVCPVGYFFLDEPPEEELPLSFRALSKPRHKLSSSTMRTLSRFYELAQWTADLIGELGVNWQVEIRPGEIRPDLEHVQEIVSGLEDYREWRRYREGQVEKFKNEEEQEGDEQRRRELWRKAREEAFQWWRWRIEQKGIFCFQMRLDPSEVRGAALWLEGRYPFILVNRRDSEAAAGRLFTLLHEYAHLLVSEKGFVCDLEEGDGAAERVERFCNRFASLMLVTPDEFRARLRELGLDRFRPQWGDRTLDRIRSTLMVSRDVVAIMLQNERLAPPDLYETKLKRWREAQREPSFYRGRGRKKQVVERLEELGFSLSTLLASQRDNPELSPVELSHILDLKIEKIGEFFELAYNKPG